MNEQFTPEERAALAPYVSNLDSSVFVLRNLPEEVIAVLFAYYSRSRDSLRRNLLKLLQEGDLDLVGAAADAPDENMDRLAAARDKARQFHEKWVVGYGHGSVAEHGCIHLALEDISIIASKLVEDGRLASYTEKSTRYVAFDPSKMYYPADVMAHPRLGEEYAATIRALLDAYTGWTEDMIAQIKARVPKTEKQTDRGYDNACRANAFDILRYLLPAATYTNIGLTLNARSLENLITKLLSQPLPEGRELGQRLKSEAQHIVPTLLKYADYNAYRAETHDALTHLAQKLLTPPLLGAGGPSAPPLWGAKEGRHGDLPLQAEQDLGAGGPASPNLPFREDPAQQGDRSSWAQQNGSSSDPAQAEPIRSGVVRVSLEPDADDRLIAAILYGYSTLPMADLLAQVQEMDRETKERVLDEYLARRGKHDAPGRALERIHCTLELTMDYGAYRDVQRHRMATQTTQPLTPQLGYETPPEIVRFGYEEPYRALMTRAAAAYDHLVEAGFPDSASYILPLATRIRVLFTWNLREVIHFVELRSARQGHPSYRRIAQQVYEAVAQDYPLVARYMRPNMNEYALTRD